MSNILNELNIEMECELTIMGFTLPFLFKASDIKSYSKNTVDATTELKSENKYLGNVEFIKNNLIKYVDIDKIGFSKETVLALEMDTDLFVHNKSKDVYNLNGLDSLYIFFTKIGATDHEYYEIKEFIANKIITIKNEMTYTIHDRLEVGKKGEHLSVEFMQVQSILEFSSAMIFHENQGKSGDMWSFREVLLRRCYLSRKYETDKALRDRIKLESKQ